MLFEINYKFIIMSASGKPTRPTTWIHADPVCADRPIGHPEADNLLSPRGWPVLKFLPSFFFLTHALSHTHIYLALATVPAWSALERGESGAGRACCRACRPPPLLAPPSRPLSTPRPPLPTPVGKVLFFSFVHFIDLHSTGFGSDGLSYANRLSVSTHEHYEDQI